MLSSFVPGAAGDRDPTDTGGVGGAVDDRGVGTGAASSASLQHPSTGGNALDY